MQHLFEKLRDDTLNWRKDGYPCQDYPLIGEILRYQFEGEADDRVQLKYLREPQFQSLELYWYLRLVLKTPHIVDLYTTLLRYLVIYAISVKPSESHSLPNDLILTLRMLMQLLIWWKTTQILLN